MASSFGKFKLIERQLFFIYHDGQMTLAANNCMNRIKLSLSKNDCLPGYDKIQLSIAIELCDKAGVKKPTMLISVTP